MHRYPDYLHKIIYGTLLIFSSVFCAVFSENVYPSIARYPSALNYWATSEVNFMSKLEELLQTTEKISSDTRNLSSVHDFDSSLSALFHRQVESYLLDYQDSCGDLRGFKNGNVTEKVKAIITNPIAAYRLMRRLVYILPGVLDRVAGVTGFFGSQEFVNSFPTKKEFWPKNEDIQDAIIGILRLNRVYDFDLKALSEGNFSGIVTGTRLRGLHCFEIGIYANSQFFHSLAVEWLELAVEKAKVDGTLELAMIRSALDTAIAKHDEYFDSRWEKNPYFFDRKLIPISNDRSIRRKQRDVLIETYRGDKDSTSNEINFWELCSGRTFQPIAIKSKMFCWYETKIHPAWLIGPLKVELLATEPDVFQVYDVIGDKRIARIKESALPTMHLSRVVDNNSNTPGATTYSKVRTSVGTWLEEDKDPILAPIPFRIEQITGLSVVPDSSSEMLQVASYTFSGHYEVHLDALQTPVQYGAIKGDRIATFMYYLSDVELGGRTAFVQAGVYAEPVKGSAVFWYDIHRDGTADQWTYHGACPVIIGQKWVSNKWIRYWDQMKTHPCSANDQNERYRIKVNGKIPNFSVENKTEKSERSFTDLPLQLDGIKTEALDVTMKQGL